jgi:hypothetical protein
MRPRPGFDPPEDFQELQASELFCARCQRSRPVRQRLLLVLPDGELFEYLCAGCGAQVGKRKVSAAPAPLLIAP